MKTRMIHTQSLAVDNTNEGHDWVNAWWECWKKHGYSIMEHRETTKSIYIKIWTQIEIGGDDNDNG